MCILQIVTRNHNVIHARQVHVDRTQSVKMVPALVYQGTTVIPTLVVDQNAFTTLIVPKTKVVSATSV